MPFSLLKFMVLIHVCLVPFAINSSCTVGIYSTLRLIPLNVRGISNLKKNNQWMIYSWCREKNTDI